MLGCANCSPLLSPSEHLESKNPCFRNSEYKPSVYLLAGCAFSKSLVSYTESSDWNVVAMNIYSRFLF